MKKSTEILIEEFCVRYSNLKDLKETLKITVEELKKAYNNKNKILVCGNGGSAADSLHIVGELMKSFVLPRKLKDEYQAKIRECFPEDADYLINNLQEAIPAISLLNESALTTAYCNDNTSDLVFAQQVYGHGNFADILIAISTSGNSKNIINAVKVAKIKGMLVISLTGKDGGVLKNLSDININVPEKETYKIQEYHLPIYHNICLAIENELFGED